MGEWGRKHFSSDQYVINYGNIKSMNTESIQGINSPLKSNLTERKKKKKKIHRPLLTHIQKKVDE